MARTFSSDLSVKGLRELQKELREYKNNILKTNVQVFVEELSKAGIQAAAFASKGNAFGNFIGFVKEVEPTKYNYQARAYLIGMNLAPMFSTYISRDEGGHTIEKTVELNPIMMAEYGAGVYARFDYRGTFPDQTHAMENQWYYATALDSKGRPTNWQVSSGVRPTMPMKKAVDEIIAQIDAIAIKCFSN